MLVPYDEGRFDILEAVGNFRMLEDIAPEERQRRLSAEGESVEAARLVAEASGRLTVLCVERRLKQSDPTLRESNRRRQEKWRTRQYAGDILAVK